MTIQLLRPARAMLPSYVAALETAWSPDNLRPAVAAEQLAAIARDADAFLRGLDDPEAKGGAIVLPDGSRVPRLPGFRRWIWDGEFCGTVGLRWQHGTPDLPPHVLGHCGYNVVPWKRRRGYATAALGLLLPEARALGLPWIELTTDADNIVSQRVILGNGGVFVERFEEPGAYGGGIGMRFRIILDPASATG